MNRIIETERILLRPFCLEDIERFAEICANPNVMHYIGDGKPASRDVIAEKIPEWMELYEKQKYGLMALVMKDTMNSLVFVALFTKQSMGLNILN